jgi:hypothetical protein
MNVFLFVGLKEPERRPDLRRLVFSDLIVDERRDFEKLALACSIPRLTRYA